MKGKETRNTVRTITLFYPLACAEDLIAHLMDIEWKRFDERIMEPRMRVLANIMIDAVLENHSNNRLKSVPKKI